MNFNFPLTDIRMGYYTAEYFNRTKKILEQRPDIANDVTMQIFQKNDAILCGMSEVIALLKEATGHWKNSENAAKHYDFLTHLRKKSNVAGIGLKTYLYDIANLECWFDEQWVSTYEDLTIKTLQDGDVIEPWESVAHISGKLREFAHLESIYLGILARSTRVATNTSKVVEAAAGKPILFFADRFDGFENQERDGYAAYVGGASAFATPAMNSRLASKATGTIPHCLIAAFGGDEVEAGSMFHKVYPDQNLIALVDFWNDDLRTAGECLEAFGDKLYGVRLDNSSGMVDQSIRQDQMGQYNPAGVSPMLVENMREFLDDRGGKHVKIIVSGGFDPEKISLFEKLGIPVDSYGVGSSLLRDNGKSWDYTADICHPIAKVGRWFRPNSKLKKVE